ncbi:SDR family oxidoreductase [Streptomyces sp. NPDC050625]|uniref:SDR family NAD(P)-dependent oxidoreductase n=1 Tax=Streptomyces sp. NPDC050625 TaxID=3154629 RepID=UPI00343B5B7E
MSRAPHAYDPERLAGRHLVVTGGTGGIGRACVMEALAAGASVSVLGRTDKALDELNVDLLRTNARGRAFLADVRDGRSVMAALGEAQSEFGPVDVLVNNAATSLVQGPFEAVDLEAWWQEFEINVRGVATCTRAVLPGMVERAGGRIINMVSGTAGRPSPYHLGYAMSKAAVVRFTDSLALELEDSGVQAFALRPGHVHSPMTHRFQDSPVAQQWMGEEVAALELAAPDLAVSAVLWLASGHGDAFNGLWVDADQDLVALAENAADVVRSSANQLRRIPASAS